MRPTITIRFDSNFQITAQLFDSNGENTIRTALMKSNYDRLSIDKALGSRKSDDDNKKKKKKSKTTFVAIWVMGPLSDPKSVTICVITPLYY